MKGAAFTSGMFLTATGSMTAFYVAAVAVGLVIAWRWVQ